MQSIYSKLQLQRCYTHIHDPLYANFFGTHTKMSFRAISDFQNYIGQNIRLGWFVLIFFYCLIHCLRMQMVSGNHWMAWCFTIYHVKHIASTTEYHCIYPIYHINIPQQNNNVSCCLFPGNFALKIPGNMLLAAAPFLSVSSCPMGYAKSQQDLRSVCIQLWHWALWRFSLYIVHSQTSRISRTQQEFSSVYAEVVS